MDISALHFNAADPAAWRERIVQGTAAEGTRFTAAAREFEAVLLRQYLAEALKPTTGEGTLFGANNQIYGYLITDALATSLAAEGTFGFTNLMQARHAGSSESDHEQTSNLL